MDYEMVPSSVLLMDWLLNLIFSFWRSISLMLFIAVVINLIRSPPALLSSGTTGHLYQLTPAQNTISKCRSFVLKPGASAVRGQQLKHLQVLFLYCWVSIGKIWRQHWIRAFRNGASPPFKLAWLCGDQWVFLCPAFAAGAYLLCHKCSSGEL